MDNRGLRITLIAALAGALLAGCGPDMGAPVVQIPAEEPDDPPSSSVNRAPTIAGSPSPAVPMGSAYRFAPTAADADGDALVWSITGKPASATFNTTTGALTWTPDGPGVWNPIIITVTDTNGASASLDAFSITVATSRAGSASLQWVPPAAYTDGSALHVSDLAAYHIYASHDAATLERVAEVDGRTTHFIAANLAPGTHFFAVTAVSASGAESDFSSIGSKTIL